MDSSCLERLKTAVTSQQSPAGLLPTAGSSRTEGDDQVTLPQDLVDQITKLVIRKEDTLVAINMHGDKNARGVWIQRTGEWIKLCDVPYKLDVYNTCIGCVPGGFVIINVEDSDSDLLSCFFSLTTNQWKRLKKIPSVGVWSSVVALDDNLVLTVGGYQSVVCEILDIKQNIWTSAASLPEPLEKPLVSLAAGQVFIVPQKSDLPYIFPVWMFVYDPRKNKHSYRSRLPRSVTNTRGACLTSMKDKLYLLGGVQGLAVQYDIILNQWMQLQPPSASYFWWDGCCAVVRGDSILLCGGSTEMGLECNRIEAFNTRRRKWKMLDSCLPLSFNARFSLVTHYSV